MKLTEARRLIREHILKSLPEIKAKRSRKVPIGRKTPAYDPNDSFHVDAINNFLELCKQYGTENVANALLNTYENFVDMGFEGAELKALHQAKIEEFKTTHSDFFKQWVQDLADDSLQEIRVKSDPLREIKGVRRTKVKSGRKEDPHFIYVYIEPDNTFTWHVRDIENFDNWDLEAEADEEAYEIREAYNGEYGDGAAEYNGIGEVWMNDEKTAAHIVCDDEGSEEVIIKSTYSPESYMQYLTDGNYTDATHMLSKLFPE